MSMAEKVKFNVFENVFVACEILNNYNFNNSFSSSQTEVRWLSRRKVLTRLFEQKTWTSNVL